MWAKLKTNQTGFTIVELLIVVVVIAILAAITIVAFNGIQERSRQSAAQAEAKQATTKIQSFAVENADQPPANLSQVGLTDSQRSQYQYRVLNSTNPPSFCLTTTVNSVSYYSTGSSAPQSGACPGHGANGVATITNHFMNPQFSGPAAPVNQTNTTSNITDYNGSQMARVQTTSTAAAGVRLQPAQNRLLVSPGQTLYASMDIHNASTEAKTFSASIRFYDSAGTNLGTQLTVVNNGYILVPAGGSIRYTIQATAVNYTVSAGLNANRDATVAAAVGDVFYVDNVYFGFVDSGFADGTSPNWAWNGEAHNSTSSGMPL